MVAVVSAMKMEMAVQSHVNGTVRATHVEVGDKLDSEDLMIEIETCPNGGCGNIEVFV